MGKSRVGLRWVLLASLAVLETTGCSSGSGKTSRDGGDAATDSSDGKAGGDASAGTGGADARGGASGNDAQAGAGGEDAAGDAVIDGANDTGSDGAGIDGSSDGPSDGGGLATFEVKTPTFTVAKQSESTQCVVLDVGNAQAIHVGHVKVTLSAPVYEVRIGAVTGAVQATPTSCTPFADIMDASVRPLMFARNDIEDLSFPAGVGYTLPAHQLVRVEIHAWNPTDGDLPANVSALFTASKDADFQHEAGFLLVENLEVSLMPGAASVQLGPQLFPLASLGAASIFRLEGYTHELGIDLTMALAASATDGSPTSIYAPAPWNPSNPLVVNEATPLAVPAAGGIALTCKWNNSTGQTTVTRGPSVLDERCAAFVSYYPAANVRLCLHQGNATGPTTCI